MSSCRLFYRRQVREHAQYLDLRACTDSELRVDAELASELYRNDDVLPLSIAYGSTPPTSVEESAEGSNHSALPRKRKRSISPRGLEYKVLVNEQDLLVSTVTEKAHASSKLISVRPPHLVYPKSLYHGHETPSPINKERLVLEQILVSFDTQHHA